MKVIFLDIDGVINCHTDFLEESRYGHPINKGNKILNRGKLALLQTIIEQTDALIVLSSTWRELYTLDKMHEMFTSHGWTLPQGTFFDITPIHRCNFSDDGYRHRGNEVKQWLDSRSDVETFVILDDRNEFKEEQQQYFIKTEFVDGLNSLQAAEAVRILGKNEEFVEKERKMNESLALFAGCMF